jgi:hypothetical protein
LFYLGNLAPDAVVDWHDKDIVHLRNLEDRQLALISLAKGTSGDFAEGTLLHLYFDWKWDIEVRKDFIEKTGDDWFVQYRNELSLVGSHAFHNTEWARQLWLDMDAVDTSSYGIIPHATSDDIKDFVSRNNKWHNENVTEPSPNFSPDLIENFTSKIANEYTKWRKENA